MQEEKNIMSFETVALDEAQNAVVIIDQTLLARHHAAGGFENGFRRYGMPSIACR